jgi:ferritin-like protein
MGSGTQSSEEDFRKEVAEHFALIEERLQRLEEQVPREQGGTEGDLPQPEGETSPDL